MSKTTKKLTWKQPDAVCTCMKWLEEKKLIRWGETSDMVTLAPVIDPFRRRIDAPFVFVRHCPNCGTANFDLTEVTP